MKTKFLSAVRKFNMICEGDRVVVGFSGGADSICLLFLLHECKDELGITVEAAHINHCIRGAEADSDEDFVRNFCSLNNIKLHCKRIDIPKLARENGESTELCARKMRYEFFNSLKADKIATAHTGSDRIETLLMNLARGATLNGLCSIPPVRDNIIRPLICFTRDDIEKYCADNSLTFVTDSSNLGDEYTRNKFRHNVVSELKRINPSFEKNVLRCLDSLNKENAFLDECAQQLIASFDNADGSIDISSLISTDKNILPRVIASYISKFSNADYEMRHIDYIVDNLHSEFALTLPGGVIIRSDGNKLYFSEKIKKKNISVVPVSFFINETFEYKIATKTVTVLTSESYDCNDKRIFVADADKVSPLLFLRSRASGDVFHLGKRKCSKNLNKLFNESKIPKDSRDELIIISDEKGLIFVENFGIDSFREINKETKNYLIIKFEDDKNE